MGGVGSGRRPRSYAGPKKGPYRRKTNRPYNRGLWREYPRAYISWFAMRARCYNQKHKDYHLYGGRGIEIRYAGFPEFVADLGERPEGMTLDRIDSDAHYEPGNCRWADHKTQAQNRRIPNYWNLRGGFSTWRGSV